MVGRTLDMVQQVSTNERPARTRERRAARPRPANREARAHRLRDGRLIGYADYGDPDGLPVFAFHGTPGSRIMFRPADAPAAARGLRLIAADRPGYGLSSFVERRGPGLVAEDMATLANALGIDRFAVVGVSGGGPFAAACAAALGERVLAAALVSPVGPVSAPSLGPSLSMTQRAIFQLLPGTAGLGRPALHVFRFLVDKLPALAHRVILLQAAAADRAILRRRRVKADLIEGLREGLRPGVDGLLRDLQIFAAPWEPDPAAITVPCAVWQGDADRNVPPAAAIELARRNPGCELKELAGIGHYWIYEHFDDVLDWVVEQCAVAA